MSLFKSREQKRNEELIKTAYQNAKRKTFRCPKCGRGISCVFLSYSDSVICQNCGERIYNRDV